MNSPPTFFGTAGEPVPAVDAGDLQTAYEILTDVNGRTGFSIDKFIRACKTRRRHSGGCLSRHDAATSAEAGARADRPADEGRRKVRCEHLSRVRWISDDVVVPGIDTRRSAL